MYELQLQLQLLLLYIFDQQWNSSVHDADYKPTI